MGQRISGPGVGLQAPAYYYPSEINPLNTPIDIANAYTSLASGETLAIPAGSWYVDPGKAGIIQFKDPVTGIWRLTSAAKAGPQYVVSDGFNARVANLTGCPVVGIVVAGGSGYTSAPTVTAGTGNSTWTAIVGGMLSVSTITNAGSGFGVPPVVLIAEPPAGGVQATGYATIQSGTVASVTLQNVGAGYVTAPSCVVVPCPSDPNLGVSTIVNATVSLAVVGSGTVSAVLCTNPGASIASAPTLTVSGGAGSGASVAALQLLTLTTAAITDANGWTGGAVLTTTGPLAPLTPWNTNPQISGQSFVPRPAQAALGPSGSISSISTLYDGGLALGTPIVGLSGSTGAKVLTAGTFTFAGAPTTVLLQPAP